MPWRPIPDEEKNRKHYLTECKELVKYQWFTLHYTTTMIAKNLNMSQRVIERTLQLWSLTDELVSLEGDGK